MSIGILCAFSLSGLLLGAGVVAAVFIAYFIAKKRGYYEDLVFDTVIACALPAFFGARLFFAVQSGNADIWTFSGFFGFGNAPGGLSVFGAAAGAAAGAFVLRLVNRALIDKNPVKFAYRNISFLQIVDLILCVLGLAAAAGSAGNFIASDGASRWSRPDFYECIWYLAVFAFLVWSYAGKSKSFDGMVSCMWLVLSGLAGIVAGGASDEGMWLIKDAVRVSQIFGAAELLFGIVLFIVYLSAAKKAGKETFVFVDEARLDETYYGYASSRVGKPSLESMKTNTKKKIEFEETPEDDEYWQSGDETSTDGDN